MSVLVKGVTAGIFGAVNTLTFWILRSGRPETTSRRTLSREPSCQGLRSPCSSDALKSKGVAANLLQQIWSKIRKATPEKCPPILEKTGQMRRVRWFRRNAAWPEYIALKLSELRTRQNRLSNMQLAASFRLYFQLEWSRCEFHWRASDDTFFLLKERRQDEVKAEQGNQTKHATQSKTTKQYEAFAASWNEWDCVHTEQT